MSRVRHLNVQHVPSIYQPTTENIEMHVLSRANENTIPKSVARSLSNPSTRTNPSTRKSCMTVYECGTQTEGMLTNVVINDYIGQHTLSLTTRDIGKDGYATM